VKEDRCTIDIETIMDSLPQPLPRHIPPEVNVLPGHRWRILRKGGVCILGSQEPGVHSLEQAYRVGRLIAERLKLPVVTLPQKGVSERAAAGAARARGWIIVVKGWANPPLLFPSSSRVSERCIIAAPLPWHDPSLSYGKVYAMRDSLLAALSRALILIEPAPSSVAFKQALLLLSLKRSTAVIRPIDESYDFKLALKRLKAAAERYRVELDVVEEAGEAVEAVSRLVELPGLTVA